MLRRTHFVNDAPHVMGQEVSRSRADLLDRGEGSQVTDHGICDCECDSCVERLVDHGGAVKRERDGAWTV